MTPTVLQLAALAAMVFVALLFLRAAWHKASDYGRFLGFLADYQLLPEWLLIPVARTLIGFEFAVVALLLWPPSANYGAMGAMALLGLYALAMAVNLLRGRTLIECGCGGAGQPLSWLLIVRNIALMGMTGLAMYAPSALAGVLAVSSALLSGLLAFAFYVVAEQVLANLATLAARNKRLS